MNKQEELYLMEPHSDILSNGKIQAKENKIINIESLDNVVDMNLNNGDKVSAGDLLYKIEDKTMQDKIDEKQNEVNKLYNKANTIKNQADNLYLQINNIVNKMNNMSKENSSYKTLENEYNRMNNEYLNYEKEYNNYLVLIDEVNNDINFYKQKQFEYIYAPISGIYNFSKENNQITIDSEDLVVVANVKEYNYDKISIGDKLSIRDIYRNENIEGTVINKSEVPNEVYGNVSEYKLIIDIQDNYINGTSVEITYNEKYIEVPNEAVQKKEDGYYIKIKENDKIEEVKVDGEFKEDVFLITSQINNLSNKEIIKNYNNVK